MTTDYLSDEDAERMARAYFPEFWAALDRDGPRNDRAAEAKRQTIDRMKHGWAARPASARALDDAALDLQTRKTVTAAALVLAALKRGIEITS